MKKFLLRLKNKQAVILIAIVLIGGLLRLYKLNQVPAGFYWDEAAIAYNAWGISIWNRDEFGNKLPLSFKSFGDYKAPLFIYTLAAIYKLAGLHPEYVRVLSALFGTANILLIYLLSKSIFSKLKHQQELSLVSAVFMAIVPWAINFSRIGSEAVFALFLLLSGCTAIFYRRKHQVLLYIGVIFLGLSLYAYHSTKIFLPLFLFGLSILFIKRITAIKWPHLLASSLLFVAIVIPLVNDTFRGQGFERGKTMIIYQDGAIAPASVIVERLSQNIYSYFSFQFWTNGQDAIGLRHNVPGHGVIYWTIFGLAIMGTFHSLYRHQRNDLFLLLWLVTGLIPSLVSTDAPHAIRSMLALPAVIFLAVTGFSILPKVIKIISLSLIGIEAVLYLSAYYDSYVSDSATAFQYGYQEAILTAEEYGKKADKFVVTDYYGQPYIYTLLYRKIKPEEFKFGALANYEFHGIKWNERKENTIYVATPEEINPNDPSVIKTITIPNTSIPVFVVASTLSH